MAIANQLTIDSEATAMQMAETIFGDGIQIVSASYTGAAGSAGVYSGAHGTMPGVTDTDQGVILSTGQAHHFTNNSGTADTNVWTNTSTDTAGIDGDADMDALAGQATYDAAIFEASFIPDGDYLTMRFVFSSDEYPEYVNLNFNDSFGVWVNGTFVEATITTSGDIAIDNVNAAANQNLYRDNTADQFNTEMDGLTYVLSFKAPVNAGEVNTIKIGIADAGDSSYDSNVLISGDSIQTIALAFDDEVQLAVGSTRIVDVLANDRDLSGTGLTVTQLMGQDVVPGQTVTLASGEQVTLNPDGTLTVVADGDAGANVLTYTIVDGLGNVDTGYLTINTVAVAGPDYVVQGTAAGEVIDFAYTGDPDGDLVDHADNQTGDHDDVIFGQGGNDTIHAGLGDDLAYGGTGDDLIVGGAGNDTLDGGAGDDQLQGGAGDDLMRGGAGNDSFVVIGGDGVDTLHGGAGTDSLVFGSVDGGGVDVQFTGDGAGGYGFMTGDGSGTFTGMETVNLTGGADNLDASATGTGLLVSGGNGDDTLTGGSGDDSLYGGWGDDSLSGGAGNDRIEGEDGNDDLSGGGGSDTILGGEGDDTISGGAEYTVWQEYTEVTGLDQTLPGSNGNPDFDHSVTTTGGSVDSWTVALEGGGEMTGYHVGNGGDANETHTHSFGQEVAGAVLVIAGIAPDETLVIRLDGQAIDLNAAIAAGLVEFTPGSTGFVVDGSGALAATQPPVAEPDPATLTILQPFTTLSVQNVSPAGSGEGAVYSLLVDTNPPDAYLADDDSIDGGAGNDLIFAGIGEDTIAGGEGNDEIDAGFGNDIATGDAGDDYLFGNSGDDTLEGGEGNDTIDGGDDQDLIHGDAGDDSLMGGGGDDTLYGGAGIDTLEGGEGDDTLIDLDGATLADGGAGNDSIATGQGDDTLSGGEGDDLIEAGAGDDSLDGGLGQDTLYGGAGNDTLHGGEDLQIPNTWAPPEFVTLHGAAGTVAGSGGNPDFDHVAASDQGALLEGTGTFATPEGSSETAEGYLLGTGSATEIHSHGFSADVGSIQLRITGLNTTETLVIWVDGQPLDLNQAMGLGLAEFAAGTTSYYIDAGGNLAAAADAPGPFQPAVLVIHGPMTSVSVETVSAGGSGGGVFYELSADATPAWEVIPDGDDSLSGGAGDDLIAGGAGDDTLAGDGGNDTLDGGAGADRLYGGADRDLILGGGGDIVDGGEEGDDHDTLVVNDVASFTYGGGNNESGTVTFNDGSTLTFQNIETLVVDGVSHGTGDGVVQGTAGGDTMLPGYTDADGDAIDGSDGPDDVIEAGDGDDSVQAGDGDDTVRGGSGNDTLHGGAGSNLLEGGDDRDVIHATGNDTVDGGEGGDDFDILVVDGIDSIAYGEDGESGIVTRSDGSTVTFTGIERIELAGGTPDGLIWGSDGGDLIGAGYIDANGDVIDNNDAILSNPGSDDDEIYAIGGNDTIHSLEGDDRVYGGTGNDLIETGAGNDYAQGDEDDDTLYGGEGDDFLRGDAGNDFVYGGAGDDSVYGGAGNDEVYGGDGHDHVYGGYGDDTVYGGAGNDTITGSGENDLIYGDDGDDFMQGSDGADTMYGGAGNDTMLGEEDADTFYGGAGDYVDGYETVTTGEDNDTLYVEDVASVSLDPGNPENGTVFFNGGGSLVFYNIERLFVDGVLHGTQLNHVVEGSAGDDVIDTAYDGDPQGDRVDAGDAADGSDDDLIEAYGGDDLVRAGAGDDTVLGGDGDDTLLGGSGNDLLSGGEGDDSIGGGFGEDTLLGDAGNDLVAGGDGNDIISGGEGDDTLLGEGGSDTIDGGDGADLIMGGADAAAAPEGLVIWVNDPDAIYRIDVAEDGTAVKTMVGPAARAYGDLGMTADGQLYGASYGDLYLIDTATGAETFVGPIGNGAGNNALSFGPDGLGYGANGSSIYRFDPTNPPDSQLWWTNPAGGYPAGDFLFVGDRAFVSWISPSGQTQLHQLGLDGDGSVISQTVLGTLPATAWGLAAGPNGEIYTVAFEAGENQLLLVDVPSAPLDGGAGLLTLSPVTGSGNDANYWGATSNQEALLGGGADRGDSLSGGAGNDIIDGGYGNDTLHGDADDDLLYGGEGDDLLYGGTGNDTLVGGAGADTLDGGDDRDLFYGGIGDSIDGGEGGDDHDTLDLTGLGDVNVVYDPDNPENGTVQFLDDSGGVVGTMTFSNIENVIVPCFTPGTLIATDRGEIRVEKLREGDRVLTRDSGYREIRWIGRRDLSAAELAASPQLNPVRIRRGALGLNLPERDLLVSPQHRMLVAGSRAELLFGEQEVLVAATHLAGRPGIVPEVPADGVSYIHLLFDRHEIVRANGAWSESYQPGALTLAGMEDALRRELLTLFPELRLGTLFPAARLSLKRHEALLLTAA